MKTVLLTGKIGSGKSSLISAYQQKTVRRFFFQNPRKFSQPILFVSVDFLGSQVIHSIISQKFFAQNTLFRTIQTKAQLKKKLFSRNKTYQNRYWNILEKILHPQIQKKIVHIQKIFQKKKGTIIFECPIPEKIFPPELFPETSQIEMFSPPHSENFLQLKKHRNFSVQEFFVYKNRQK